MSTVKEVTTKIKQAIRYDEINESEAQLSLTIDRYRRHDHGGGDDGDDWLDDHEIDKDFNRGKEAHSSKLARVNQILEENKFIPNAEFELGEKGHFSIEIDFQVKK